MVHTCFSTLDVILNPLTASTIAADIPVDDSASDFDNWIHSLIADNSTTLYNFL